MWGKSTDFILIHGLYIVSRLIPWVFSYSTRNKTPETYEENEITHGLPEFFGFINPQNYSLQ